MNNYNCKQCGESFRLSKIPTNCPYCGSLDITCKSIETATQMIIECNHIVDELNVASEQFSKLLAEYQIIAKKLDNYARRGIIKKEDIPKYIRSKAYNYLKN